eukprot:209081_1
MNIGNDNNKNGNIINIQSFIEDSMMKDFMVNEGQYHVQYSDSEESNNDNHGADEVIVSVLMPKNDSSSISSNEEDNNKNIKKINENKSGFNEFDVDNILDDIGEDLIGNLNN